MYPDPGLVILKLMKVPPDSVMVAVAWTPPVGGAASVMVSPLP